MVLESLLTPLRAERHPAWLLLVGAVYTVMGLYFALHFFPQHASMALLVFITGASIPLLYNMIKYEEDKDFSEMEESALLKEHGRAVMAYFMLFVGITLTLTVLFLVLPSQTMQQVFDAQIGTYQAINPHHAIQGAHVTGYAGGMGFFTRIFLNNVRVLTWCVLLSFFYGAGAILVLSWNASILGLAIGNTIRQRLAEALAETGSVTLASYLTIPSGVVLLRYGLHAPIEILAYIVAGLAGGIISVAVIRHHFSTRKFEHIIIDSADLLLVSIALLFVGAVVEAWVTPMFY